MRQDLQYRSLAAEKGYAEVFHVLDIQAGMLGKTKDDIPHFPISFKKEKKVIWYAGKKWICADITNSPKYYCNHRHYKDLLTALMTEN